MKYQRAKVINQSVLRYSITHHFVEWRETLEHDIPQTVIEALNVMPNMPVMIGGYLYRVVS